MAEMLTVFSSSLSEAFSRPSCLASSSTSGSSSYSVVLLRAPTLVNPRLYAGPGKARVTCVFGGDKRDAARKALEAALGEKKEVFSKWDEEIKKREASGGGGGKGRGRGWGGGGNGGRDESSSSEGNGTENNWDEAIQVFYAFVGLAALYVLLTQGTSILALVLNSILYVSRGFKPRPAARYVPVAPEGSINAESHVRRKWGSDD